MAVVDCTLARWFDVVRPLDASKARGAEPMTQLLLLLTVHFVADFLLQSDWMAVNKSKRWDALSVHVLVYSVPFLWWGVPFAAMTFVLHFAQDAVTSRITSRLWAANKRHWFFVAIGFDQLLHAYALAWTWIVLR